MRSLTLVRRIKARPSIVFDLMTTAEGVATWFGPDELPVVGAEMDARVGGSYRVRFRTVDGRDHEAIGTFLEVVPPLRVVMSFRWAVGGESDEQGQVSQIAIDLTPTADGTELTFTHAGLSSDASRESHAWGWGRALDKLARRLEQGQKAPEPPRPSAGREQ